VTAGFYSKDAILLDAWSSPSGNVLLWLAGLAGALLTSLYTFRLVFITFFGEARQQVTRRPGLLMQMPLVVLAALSVVAGLVNLPRTLGNVPLLFDFLHTSLPVTETTAGVGVEAALQIASAVASLGGIYLAYRWFYLRPETFRDLAATSVGGGLHRFWLRGWGFDWLYETVFVQPYVWLARVSRQDVIDVPFRAAAWVSRVCWYGLSQTQTGNVRWYAAALAAGAIVTIAIVVIL
jgi:NADH-quinone oxidoreductase subunit L